MTNQICSSHCLLSLLLQIICCRYFSLVIVAKVILFVYIVNVMFCCDSIKFAMATNSFLPYKKERIFFCITLRYIILDLETDLRRKRRIRIRLWVIRLYSAPAIHLARDTIAVIEVVIISFSTEDEWLRFDWAWKFPCDVSLCANRRRRQGQKIKFLKITSRFDPLNSFSLQHILHTIIISFSILS